MTTAVAQQLPATGRRVTPTGRLVLGADASRDTWLQVRRLGIGSSDIPKVMGLSNFGGQRHVYYDKRGMLPPETEFSEAAHFGTLFEEPLARDWARRNRSVIRKVGVVAHEDDAWRQCSLDRLVTECPHARSTGIREVCALEVKTRNAHVASKWKRRIPDDVLAQVLWQLDVTGLDHIHVACLIGGQDYRQYTVRRAGNEQVIADIQAVSSRLWHEYVLTRRVPPAMDTDDPDALADLYDDLNPDRAGLVRLDTDPEVLHDLADYASANAAEREAKAAKKQLRARLVERLGSADTAVLGDRPAYTYSERSKAHVDLDQLAERFPDAFAACVTERPYRQLDIAKTYLNAEN
jgi:putative phage-type endonuclease